MGIFQPATFQGKLRATAGYRTPNRQSPYYERNPFIACW